MMKPASHLCCLALLALVSGAGADMGDNTRNKPLFSITARHELPNAQETFDEIRRLILEHYYTDEITERDLYWAAIQGMLEHVSPPKDPERATLWSEDEYERVLNALKGVRVSIGIKSNYNQADGSLTVTDVYANSPADGIIHPFDRILRINGERLLGKPVNEIDTLLNGKPGEKVVLTLVRDIQTIDVSLTFRPYTAENIEIAVLPGNTGYMNIKKISKDVSAEVREALVPLEKAGVRKLVIDLRGNSGGVFHEGLKLAEIFLDAKTPVLHTLERGDRVQTFVSGNSAPLNFELSLLVDEKTASSSEIFAGALQANGRARLVGKPTFGKATVEKTFTLENRYRVKFIVGAMYKPGGKSWHETGLQPDVTVEEDALRLAKISRLPIEDRLRNDRQLSAAWQLLQ